jgi:hypothetical protein
MLYIVQYRCLYRDYWRDDQEFTDFASAQQRALYLKLAHGRNVRVISQSGTVMAAA